MPKTSAKISAGTALVLITAAFVIATTGCSVKKATSAGTTLLSPIEKGTQTQPQITSVEDQLLLAFNEVSWTRQTAALAINPPNLSTQDGCVLRRPLKGPRFLIESFSCTRMSDESDRLANHRFEFSGDQSYTLQQSSYRVDGLFSSKIYSRTEPAQVVSYGRTERTVEIEAPTGILGSDGATTGDLKSSVYHANSVTNYNGSVARESNRLPEFWKSTLATALQVATAQPLKVLAGSVLTFSYVPEVAVAEKGETQRQPQLLTLVAKTDVNFASDGTCMRPVGTFDWTMAAGATTQSGVVTTTADGYIRAGETTAHVWGHRCLER